MDTHTIKATNNESRYTYIFYIIYGKNLISFFNKLNNYFLSIAYYQSQLIIDYNSINVQQGRAHVLLWNLQAFQSCDKNQLFIVYFTDHQIEINALEKFIQHKIFQEDKQIVQEKSYLFQQCIQIWNIWNINQLLKQMTSDQIQQIHRCQRLNSIKIFTLIIGLLNAMTNKSWLRFCDPVYHIEQIFNFLTRVMQIVGMRKEVKYFSFEKQQALNE